MATDTEFSKALTLHRSGRLAEAEALYRSILDRHSDHPGALHLLGLIEISKQNYVSAMRLIRRSIESGGPNAMRLNDLGSACRAAGDLNEAADSFRSALSLKKDLTPAWLGLAGVLREQGRLSDAIDTLEEGRQRVPREANLGFNLATLLAESGDYERAAIGFGALLDDDPGQIAASLSLGKVLRRMANAEEAEEVYRRSLGSAPGNADLLNAIAEIRMESGQLEGAERLLRQALENHPGHINAWFNLGKTLLSARRMDADFLARWLSIDGPVPGIVRRAGTEHVRSLTEFGRVADRVESVDSSRNDFVVSDCVRNLMADPVLGLLLRKGPIDDLALEGVLTSLRRDFLLSRWEDPTPEQLQSESPAFLISLAQQCFHNEYVYEVEADEAEALASLREAVEHGPATIADVALLAAYMPLFQLDKNLLSWAGSLSEGKAELQDLLRQQISEPLEERELASDIKSVSAIEDSVSLAVREQYEDNPYPRWDTVGRLDTHPVGLVLGGLFPFLSAQQTAWPQSPDILVAGCGTGHQSVASAQRFANCHVTAIDLSLASLAYAKRKTRQAGISNIDYRQGDILKLADLEDRFDIIECTGVLHHMADPLAGWGVLRSLLNRGGLMKIGLYSELGRESIVAARAIVEREGFATSPDGIRAARKLIGSLPANDPARQVIERPDFYTMSTCRDLIFHVQEHRLTLPRISKMLDTLELEFLGFELPSSDIATSFRARFPDDPDMRSLANWGRFEQDEKGAFSRMYLFWVRDSRTAS
jgi:tetratricopeptide (TPR) repeat protein/SAM-dependent methyltransferase